MAVKLSKVLVRMLSDNIEKIDGLEKKYDREQFDSWRSETSLILEQLFGEDSDKVKAFKRYNGNLGVYWSGESESALQVRRERAYFSDLKGAKSFLNGLLSFMKKIADEPQQKMEQSIKQSEQEFFSSQHVFHPVIAEVAGPLFRDGHYRDAVRSAFIEVIDRVKNKTGRRIVRNGAELDGDDLINQTFAFESGEPLLSWSAMSTTAEKDFQRGMYFLFKGLVFLRNEKGHANVEQKDKEKAFEYLALTSLLMRQLDDTLSENE